MPYSFSRTRRTVLGGGYCSQCSFPKTCYRQHLSSRTSQVRSTYIVEARSLVLASCSWPISLLLRATSYDLCTLLTLCHETGVSGVNVRDATSLHAAGAGAGLRGDDGAVPGLSLLYVHVVARRLQLLHIGLFSSHCQQVLSPQSLCSFRDRSRGWRGGGTLTLRALH